MPHFLMQYKGKNCPALSINACKMLELFEQKWPSRFHEFIKAPEAFPMSLDQLQAEIKTSCDIGKWKTKMIGQIQKHFQSGASEPAASMKPEHRAIFLACAQKVTDAGTWSKSIWEKCSHERRMVRINTLYSIKDQIDSWGYPIEVLIKEVSIFFGIDEPFVKGSSSNQTSPDPGQDRSQEQPTPTPTTDIMSDYSNTPVARPTLVFGEDVSSVSEARAIQLIKANNDQIKELGSIGVTSSRLEQRVAGLKAANAELVKRLDSFATVEAPAEA